MKRFFNSSPPLLYPHDLVSSFTGKAAGELALPERAIIVFGTADLKNLLSRRKHKLIDAWLNFRKLYKIEGSITVIVKSHFGGPNIAALVEELSAFGVREFVLWGYAGGIDSSLKLGDVVVASRALREDGVSFHYTDDNDDFAATDWFAEWEQRSRDWGFKGGAIWSCDAIYRETCEKVEKHRKAGIAAVEMEVASFYSVCRYKGLKGIAFLIISDILGNERWTGGFHTKPFRDGVKTLSAFMEEIAIK